MKHPFSSLSDSVSVRQSTALLPDEYRSTSGKASGKPSGRSSSSAWALGLLLCCAAGLAAAAERDFNLEDLSGARHELADYRGKWIVVNYWATWCPPCLDEIPDLVHFHDAHKDRNAVVLGVNFEDIEREQLEAFVDEYLISYPVLLSDTHPKTALGTVQGLPTTFLIDPAGKLVARQQGPVTRQMLEDFIGKRAGRTVAR